MEVKGNGFPILDHYSPKINYTIICVNYKLFAKVILYK